MKETSTPMTLTAMQTFARRQLAHYTELVAVLDKIAVDPLSVLPQEQAAPKAKRRRRRKVDPVPTSRTASAYARAALQKLRVATVNEIVAHAKKAGWDSISKNPDVVMFIELKKLVASKVIRRITHKGQRAVRFAMATPSRAAAAKLAEATALAELNGRPPATPEAVN
jgi:CO dehydrogenase/acetyl-CoA synthase epsilon subunit